MLMLTAHRGGLSLSPFHAGLQEAAGASSFRNGVGRYGIRTTESDHPARLRLVERVLAARGL